MLRILARVTAVATLALALHAFARPRGEEWEDEGERRHEHLRQRVDDRELLEDDLGGVERCEERHVAVPHAVCIVHEQVGEPVGEGAPVDAAELNAAPAHVLACDLLRECLHLGA